MAGALELGLLINTAPYVRDDAVPADLTPIFRQAELAEELGFDHVWAGDSSRMEREWPRADCISLLAALAMRVSRVKLGVIPLNAPLRDPVLLAHQLATLDAISGGRLLVSPASGKQGPEGIREFANVGIPYNERGPRFTEILEILRRLWTEPSVSFQGRFYHLEDATVFPKPINRPIPTLVATGRDERALRRAGRFGDGWFTIQREPASFAAEYQKVKDAAVAAGRSASDIGQAGLYATFHLARDGEQARAEAIENLRVYFGVHLKTTSDFFGTPAEVAGWLQGLVDGGLTMVVVRFVDPDVSTQTELLREAIAVLRRPSAAGG